MSKIKNGGTDASAFDDDKTVEIEKTIEEPFTLLDPELDLVVVGGGKCASSTKAMKG